LLWSPEPAQQRSCGGSNGHANGVPGWPAAGKVNIQFTDVCIQEEIRIIYKKEN